MKAINKKVALVLMLAAVALAAQEGWVKYSSSKYGFSMLVPEGSMVRPAGKGGASEIIGVAPVAGLYPRRYGVLLKGDAVVQKTLPWLSKLSL